MTSKRILVLILVFCTRFSFALPLHQPIPGGIAVVELPGRFQTAPHVRFQDRSVIIQPLTEKPGHYRALVGLPLTLTPGMHRLRIAQGGLVNFSVKAHTYPSQKLTITDKGKVKLSEKNQARANAEAILLNEKFDKVTEMKIDESSFDLPLKGRISGIFGLRRLYNDTVKGYHRGVDIAGPIGAPIRAPAAGQVMLAKDLFYTGNTLLLDHGGGMISIYAHLSRFDAHEGQMIQRGQVIGRVGKTGRVTGPHLHFGLSMNGARVDPFLWLNPAARAQVSG